MNEILPFDTVGAIRQIGEGILLTDIEHRIIYANPAAEKIFGVWPGQLTDKTVLDFLADKDRQIFEKQMELRQAGEKSEYEMEIVAATGEHRQILINGAPRTDAAGRFWGTFAICRDVTQRRQAERALRESQRFLRAILDNIPDPAWLKDAHGRYLIGNKPLAEIHNHRAPNIIVETVFEIFCHPGGKSVETDNTAALVCKPVRKELCLPDDQGRSRWFDAVETPFFGENGKLAGIVGIAHDITAQKKADEERHRKTVLLEALISSTPDGILVVDEKGRRLVQNAQLNRLLKIPPHLVENPDDGPQLEYVSDSTRNPDQFRQDVLHLYSHPELSSRDEIEFKDGRVLDRNTASVFDDKGKYLGRLWSFRDVTERKQMAKSVQQSEKKFRALFESARDAKFILDPQGNLLDANREACRQLQYTCEELLRMNIREIDTPENAALATERIRRVLEQGHSLFETAVRRRDGSVVPLEVNSQLTEHEGQPLIFATCRDLTERKHSDEKLKQISDRLLLATSAANVGIWDFDVIQDRLVWDDAMYRLYGITPDLFAGKYAAWLAGLYPDDRDRANQEVQAALRSGTGFDSEFRVLWPDKSVHYIKARARVECDASGRAIRMIGTNWDITERKDTEEKIIWQNSALKNAANAIAILNREGNILFVNDAFCALTGYTEQEVLGKSSRLFKSGAHSADFYRQLWETVTAGFVWRGEVTNRRKDGSLYQEEMTITPIRAPSNGNITHFIAIKQDVTERKHAEDVVHKMARVETGRQKNRILKELAVILAVGGLYVGFMDYTHWLQPLAGRFARDYRNHLDDVINISLVALAGFSIFVCRRWREIKRLANRQMDAERALLKLHAELEMRVQQRTNELNESNKSLQKEIAERQRAEESRKMMEVQLRQAQKLEAVGQLAAGIAHEINTPIQYIGDNTRFLQDAFASFNRILQNQGELLAAAKENRLGPDDWARAEELYKAGDPAYFLAQAPQALEETLDGLGRVTKIVRAMKEFSHPGSKEKTPADLNKAIETTTMVARNEWKYVADLKLDLSPDLPPVPCYLGEFNQSILNLIVNAAHAIRDVVAKNPGSKGFITISTRLVDGHAEIRVSDTGTGIAEEHRQRIFEPFFTTKAVGQGTGQGLALVYSTIVQRHGGTAAFETEVGRGATFILRLPVNPALSGPAKTPKAAPQ